MLTYAYADRFEKIMENITQVKVPRNYPRFKALSLKALSLKALVRLSLSSILRLPQVKVPRNYPRFKRNRAFSYGSLKALLRLS
jgi:rRNA pseudouridine-1189 N-methylase Emg1 (Nep1/Mra1 family)